MYTHIYVHLTQTLSSYFIFMRINSIIFEAKYNTNMFFLFFIIRYGSFSILLQTYSSINKQSLFTLWYWVSVRLKQKQKNGTLVAINLFMSYLIYNFKTILNWLVRWEWIYPTMYIVYIAYTYNSNTGWCVL